MPVHFVYCSEGSRTNMCCPSQPIYFIEMRMSVRSSVRTSGPTIMDTHWRSQTSTLKISLIYQRNWAVKFIRLLTQKISLAIKTLYDCDGISTRQHNEPAGNQDVWHYHLHVFPRYADDHLYKSQSAFMPAEERAEYANLLRIYFSEDR